MPPSIGFAAESGDTRREMLCRVVWCRIDELEAQDEK
jgi:hypothetical protein